MLRDAVAVGARAKQLLELSVATMQVCGRSKIIGPKVPQNLKLVVLNYYKACRSQRRCVRRQALNLLALLAQTYKY